MSTTNLDIVPQPTRSVPPALRAAGLAILVAAATSAYGAYGDPHASASQEHGVPIVVGAAVVLAALIFGLLVPWASRTVTRAAGWGLGLSAVGILAIPMAFWSGLPIILAAAGVFLGLHARRAAAQAGHRAGLATAAVAAGVTAAILSTALVIIGNTVLA